MKTDWCDSTTLKWHTAFADERNLDVQSQQWYEVDCDMQMEDQWKGIGGAWRYLMNIYWSRLATVKY